MALKYQVAILSVWWNRGEVDTRLFSSKTERDRYFNNRNPYWNSLNNFNIRDNITTTIVFRDESGRTIDELLKCNYAIVRHQTGEDTYTYRYFYIVAIVQDSNNQVICTIDLDDVQNNLYDLIDNNLPIYVKNWTGYNYKTNNNILYYPLDENKSMAKSGDSPSLYHTRTEKIRINQYDDYDLDIWLHENIKAWRYIYVVDNQQLVRPRNDINNHVEFITSIDVYTNIDNNVVRLPYCAVSEPLYASDKRIYIKYIVNNTNYYLKLESTGIESFFNIVGTFEGDTSPYQNGPIGTYGISSKYSILSPLGRINTRYEIDGDGDLIITAYTTGGNNYNINTGVNQIFRTSLNMPQYANTSKAAAEIGITGGIWQDKTTYNATAPNPIQTNNVDHESTMKMLDSEYTTLKVRLGSQSYDYNPLALITFSNSNYIGFKYTEVLKVGITKAYLRAVGNGLYTEEQESDYTGLIASLDLTEPLLTNQWADYLANNKLYYMQTAFNNSMTALRGLVGASNADSEAEGMGKGAKVGANYVQGEINRNWDISEKKLSPNSLVNANGDPYFNIEISGIAPTLDLYETKAETKNSIISKFLMQGMTINRLMYITDVFYSHRSYDAIALNIYFSPLTNLSSKEFERLKAYLSNNHRYWYNDTMNFENPYIK